VDQPWHRDFAMPPETRTHRRLSSLAINVTTVDTTADMGPFEIAPGTQFDDDAGFEHGMFPPRSAYPRYQALAGRRMPQRGDISIRSALTIHRGTANHSALSRPVLVLGLVSRDVEPDDAHGHAVTESFRDSLPVSVLSHLRCPVVDVLQPVPQRHTIEGLVMGEP
jgi:ectoine hydroxylase-related dioxygenase (phytanoyl-CoA dioxygenase family)